jgi:hypothetical protein
MMKTGVKFSPNCEKILDGTGLAAVRKGIEEAFSHIRAPVSIFVFPESDRAGQHTTG